jgi:polyisoprenyl-teichoic acid--peptidoglycan teichoic acid transferase
MPLDSLNLKPKSEVELPLPEINDESPAPFKPRRKRKLFGFALVFLLVAFLVFTSEIIVSGQSSTSWLGQLPIIKQISDYVIGADRKLKGEDNDRINILLLGIGGKGHDGAYLTDTIMLASLQPSTKKVALISIPRDLAVPMEGMGQQKINAIDSYAESKEPGSGGLAVSQAVSNLLNIPVDYYVRVDFDGFINIINALGGVDIYVDNTLEDYSYPILGNEDNANYDSRYEHLHIDQGWQHMDGSLALKYARSRHAYGVEGSDFARAKRQQKIIEAVKDKVLNVNMLLQPMTISNITGQLQDHVSTNLQVWEMLKLWSAFKDIKKENIINKVLDNGPDGMLVDARGYEGAYLLEPKSGDFGEIQYFVNNIFNNTAPAQTKTNVLQEKATVEVRNGTWVNGLAGKKAIDLEKYGFTISRIGNSSQRNVEKTTIYDLTYGAKKDSLAILKDRTKANVSLEMPQWLTDEISREVAADKKIVKPDFILIIGQDADSTNSGSANPENLSAQ